MLRSTSDREYLHDIGDVAKACNVSLFPDRLPRDRAQLMIIGRNDASGVVVIPGSDQQEVRS